MHANSLILFLLNLFQNVMYLLFEENNCQKILSLGTLSSMLFKRQFKENMKLYIKNQASGASEVNYLEILNQENCFKAKSRDRRAFWRKSR